MAKAFKCLLVLTCMNTFVKAQNTSVDIVKLPEILNSFVENDSLLMDSFYWTLTPYPAQNALLNNTRQMYNDGFLAKSIYDLILHKNTNLEARLTKKEEMNFKLRNRIENLKEEYLRLLVEKETEDFTFDFDQVLKMEFSFQNDSAVNMSEILDSIAARIKPAVPPEPGEKPTLNPGEKPTLKCLILTDSKNRRVDTLITQKYQELNFFINITENVDNKNKCVATYRAQAKANIRPILTSKPNSVIELESKIFNTRFEYNFIPKEAVDTLLSFSIYGDTGFQIFSVPIIVENRSNLFNYIEYLSNIHVIPFFTLLSGLISFLGVLLAQFIDVKGNLSSIFIRDKKTYNLAFDDD